MSTTRLIEAFEEWRTDENPLVLATVVVTQGSTYTKAGHRIIIAANGDYQGLVSGGCLEGDLAEHARAVAAGAPNELVTYDMREESDEIFGTGVGCYGAITILLQRLVSETDYEPFRTIAAGHRYRGRAMAAVIIASENEPDLLGGTATRVGDRISLWGVSEGVGAALTSRLNEFGETTHGGRTRLDTADGNIEVLFTLIPPLVRMLVLGAGADALPLIRIAGELGWLVCVADHREQAVKQAARFANEAHHVPAEQLSTIIEFNDFAAAVVMSHNLDADRAYLGQLAKSRIPFLGLLGPKVRRDRLVDELGLVGSALDERLYGPVGLDLGADSPETIALSIAAQIQGLVAERRQHSD
jgi:xanthine/CO dehydrogenase XdhC/CoxF family maturation factor